MHEEQKRSVLKAIYLDLSSDEEDEQMEALCSKIGSLEPIEDIKVALDPYNVFVPSVEDFVVVLDTYTYSALTQVCHKITKMIRTTNFTEEIVTEENVFIENIVLNHVGHILRDCPKRVLAYQKKEGRSTVIFYKG